MNLIIRNANKDDLPAILDLYAQPDMDNGKVLLLRHAEKIFNRMKQYPNYTVYIALIDNKVVGTFALLIMDNLARMGTPSGIIEDVVVAKNYHSQGIGKMVMRYAMDTRVIQQC